MFPSLLIEIWKFLELWKQELELTEYYPTNYTYFNSKHGVCQLFKVTSHRLYRVSCYILGTLQALFKIESVDRFLKLIGRIDKEDCAINLLELWS